LENVAMSYSLLKSAFGMNRDSSGVNRNAAEIASQTFGNRGKSQKEEPLPEGSAEALKTAQRREVKGIMNEKSCKACPPIG